MAKVTDEVLGHGADADGIEEFDNPLPDWWVGLFVGTIIFAGIYPIYFHGMEGNTQAAAYDLEMAAAAEKWPVQDQPTTLPTDAESIAAGEKVYQTTCASCHKADLTGGIGPNLVDATWVHGSEPSQVLNTVTNGVAAKGMPAWGSILGPKKVQQVAAFVLSKKGSAPVAAPAPAPAEPAAPDGEPSVPAPAGGPVAPTPDAPVDGAAVYTANCAVCHKPDMTGQVGPNLVDDEWIHGGELAQIQATITNGVPTKGMIAWGPILSGPEIEAVAQYVHSGGKQTD